MSPADIKEQKARDETRCLALSVAVSTIERCGTGLPFIAQSPRVVPHIAQQSPLRPAYMVNRSSRGPGCAGSVVAVG
jgi:hypothetical protein